MREIKFRGQDYQGKWHYGSLVILTDDYGELNYFILEGNPELEIIEPDDFTLVRPETVGQFIGATDKNNREIYKGDVVQMNDGRYFTVIFDSYAFLLDGGGVSYYFNSRDTKEMSVVGNIYDKKIS